MPALSTATIARTVHSGYDLAQMVRVSGFRRLHLAGPLDTATIIELAPAMRSAEMDVVSLDARICSGHIFGNPDTVPSWAAADNAERRAAVLMVEEAIRFAADLGASVVFVPAAEDTSEPMFLELERFATAGELGSDAGIRARVHFEARLDSRRHDVVERISESLGTIEDLLDDTGINVALPLSRPPYGLPDRRALAMVMSRFGRRVGCWHDPDAEGALAALGLGSSSSFSGRFAERLLGEFIPVRPGETGGRIRSHGLQERPHPVPVICPAATVSGAGLRAVAKRFARPAA